MNESAHFIPGACVNAIRSLSPSDIIPLNLAYKKMRELYRRLPAEVKPLLVILVLFLFIFISNLCPRLYGGQYMLVYEVTLSTCAACSRAIE
jgi:hypothetical protein